MQMDSNESPSPSQQWAAFRHQLPALLQAVDSTTMTMTTKKNLKLPDAETAGDSTGTTDNVRAGNYACVYRETDRASPKQDALMKRRQEAAAYRQRLSNIRRLVDDCARLQNEAAALDAGDDDNQEQGISALRVDHARLRCLRAHRVYIAAWLQGRRISYVR